MQYEPWIRLVGFLSVLFLMIAWETVAPRRPLLLARKWRWLSNLTLVAVNTIVVRLLFAIGAVGVAMFAKEQGWGLLHVVATPSWLSIPLSLLALDFTIYAQHVLFHVVPPLWRVHAVHHADLDFDVTTGLRFHTIEILLSFGIKAGAIVLLGTPAVAVLVFEVLLNTTSMFTHGNARLPAWLDQWLRMIVVTPDMHRIHHSIVRRETNSNFGFNLSWWDRLLGTYRAQPAAGHDRMTIGLAEFRDERVDRLPWMMVLPWVKQLRPTAEARDLVDRGDHNHDRSA